VGLQLTGNGGIRDVRENSAAWKAALAPGMQIVAINGREFAPELWTETIKGAKGSTAPIHLLVKQGHWYQKMDLDYHEGVKYPHLERIAGIADMFSAIMQPHAATP